MPISVKCQPLNKIVFIHDDDDDDERSSNKPVQNADILLS